MPAPLPKALRDRFARLIREGLSGREASRRLQLSAATGVRWAQQIRTVGAATVAPIGRPSGTGKLAAHAGFFRECLVPEFDGALSAQAWKDALWDRFYTGAPARQRQSVERYNIVKRA